MVRMTEETWKKIVALGALTGMRSMAGLATLAMPHRTAGPVTAFAAAGEMIADKTRWIGNRVDPLPLGGRALIGAAVGAFVAAEQDQDVLLGGAIGAVTAVVAAHLAYHARKRLPLPGIAAGLLEDGLVMAIASRYA
jgi:uncharacterized membrane protein